MTLRRSLAHHARQGVGLFQVLLAVGLAGVLIIAAVALFQRVDRSIQHRALVRDVQKMVSDTREIFAGFPNYDGINVQLLDKYGRIGGRMKRGTTFVHRMTEKAVGDSILVNKTGPRGARNDHFYIGLSGMDNDSCTYVLEAFVGRTYAGDGFYGVGVLTAWGGPTWSQFTASPIAVSWVDGQCTKGLRKNHVYLAFQ